MSTWFLDIPIKRLIVILASESPRRFDLLKQIGINPIVEISGYDEKMDDIKVSGSEFVKGCSRNKAKMVADRLKATNKAFDIVIGCDTVIEMDGEIFGKPKDDEDALRMLKRFRSNKHKCLTGLTLIDAKLNEDVSVTETLIEFTHIPDTVLQSYIESGEHRGCAGSYRIQGKAAVFIKGIEGCYYNVVGLPLQNLCEKCNKYLNRSEYLFV